MTRASIADFSVTTLECVVDMAAVSSIVVFIRQDMRYSSIFREIERMEIGLYDFHFASS